MKTFLTIILTAALTAAGVWFIVPRHPQAAGGQREPLYYQSAMHPWIKSDKPGRCTICGMELTPVYPGEAGFDSLGGGDIVPLSQSQIHVLNVQTTPAAVAPLTRTLRVAGMIDDDATRHRVLSAYIDARIEKLEVNYVGAEVKEGQPLARIYSAPLLQAEREFRQLTGDLKRLTGLRLRQMGLTQAQIDTLDTKPADALTSDILAPMGGTVVSQNVFEGQTVTAGERLFEIADFSTMWFIFQAYEQDLPWLAVGQSVDVTTRALPGQTFTGKITFINPNIDEATRSAMVRVELPNPLVNGRRALLHKLYAEGLVRLDVEPVLSVPRSAVIHTGSEPVVYVQASQGAYRRTPVTLGRRGDTHLEILSGLSAGDPVVTQGNLLIDGQAEMNRSFAPTTDQPGHAPAHIHGASGPTIPTQDQHTATPASLTPDQQDSLRAFLTTADAMAAALAADDLAKFNAASHPTMEVTAALAKALANQPALKQLGDELVPTSHLHGFDDLASARAAFLKFSTAATKLVATIRTTTPLPDVQILDCAMVDEAIPNAPKHGRWLQLNRPEIANPYFGSQMLKCGSPVKP